MSWQDYVLSAASFLVFGSLLPTVIGEHKLALATSLMTAVLVAIVASTLATLELWLAAAGNGAVALAWLTIAVQMAVRRSRDVS